MPNYQQGVIYGIQTVAHAIGQNTEIPQIKDAATALSTPGTKWGFGKNSAVHQYIEARNLLQDNISKIEMNENLYLAIIDNANYALLNIFRETASFIDSTSIFKSDNKFYFNRGALYSLYILIRDAYNELNTTEENDYIVSQSKQLLGILLQALEYEPMVIFSFSETPTVIANHLLVQNYYIGQAALVMKDIVNRR